MDNTKRRRTAPGFARTGIALLFGLSGFISAAWAQQPSADTGTASAAPPAATAAEPTPEAAIAREHQYDIVGGDLAHAVDQLAEQSQLQIIYDANLVEGKTAPPLSGSFTVQSALDQLLVDTGLEWEFANGKTFVLRLKPGAMLEGADAGIAEAAVVEPPATSVEVKHGGIEEIIVTARKRKESVENIPISITALNTEDLKQYGVRNFADLEGVVPGLNLGGGGNGVKKDSSPYIRGVGQRETKVTLDSAVATYIDGIYIGRAAGAMLDVTDVENIQVLRGPQGTLFGRNATGGAISVTLKKPDNSWTADVTTNLGNYGRRDVSGTFNAPLIEDMLMGRLYVASTKSNGYFTNVVDNSKWGGDNRVSGIAQLRYLPTDKITVDVLGERTHIRETPRPQHCAFIRDSGFNTAQSQVTGAGSGYPGYYFNTFEDYCRESEALPPSKFASDEAIGDRLQPKGRYWVDTSTLGLTGTWDIGDVGPFSGVTAKSIAAWRQTKQIADEDLDGVAAPTLMRIQPTFDKTNQLSEELQFSGRTLNDRLFLSTGLYAFKEKTPQNFLNLSAGVSPQYSGEVTGGGPDQYLSILAEGAQEKLETNNKAYAWYGQADFDITKELELSAGIRGTRETRWSRYSKGYVNSESIYDGVLATLVGNGITYVINSQPGIKPILDWDFGTYVYTLDEQPNGDQLLHYPSTFNPGMFVGDELSTTDVAWTPTVNLKYKLGDQMLERLSLNQAMVYVTYSQGFHAGGVTAGAIDYDQVNTFFVNYPPDTGVPCPQGRDICEIDKLAGPGGGTADPQIFKPEKVTNYETGIKLAALDRRLQVNLSAFYMDYTNMQVTSTASRLGIPIPFIENVGKSVIKGLEWEVTALPTSQWRIMVNGSFTDAKIKKWESKQVILNGFTGEYTGQSYLLDRSDERMPRVPRWQFFASTDYTFRLAGGGVITPSVAVRFTSSIYHGFDRGSWIYSHGGRYYNHGGELAPDVNNADWHGGPDADPVIKPAAGAKWTTTARPTAFLDARVAWISDSGKMEAALWGKNLTNHEDYLVGGIPLADVTGGVGMVFGNPRTFGMSATYHFGE